MILLIDAFDSYVYNLAQRLSRFQRDIRVVRMDQLEPARLEAELTLRDRLILSPGPCGPEEALPCLEVLRRLGHRLPILGVCLGHQCLGHVFGMPVVQAALPVHGQASMVLNLGGTLLQGLPERFQAGRYHSLVVAGPPPPSLRITACLEDGTLMGLEHRALPLFGVQFHPESILTPEGFGILQNFLEVDPRAYPGLGDRSLLALPAQGGPVIREGQRLR